ncbi:MAG: acyltransferase [Planctomycetota bacterium]|jgi:acetyltransferase-like isoleucine patch superfamily enzyme
MVPSGERQGTVRIHSTAEVSPKAEIGSGTSIWNQAQIREGATIGENCILGKDVYIDVGVYIGNCVKIQNGVSVFHGVTIEDGVFVGPHVCFTNDKYPRAINPDGSLKSSNDWQVSQTRIKYGAALGACSVILPGIMVGKWAVVGAGAVVTCDVPAYGLVVGHPAQLKGFVCPCGGRLQKTGRGDKGILSQCALCGAEIDISEADWGIVE